jgi:thiosulfate dehydrogenase [quinone] large subunit
MSGNRQLVATLGIVAGLILFWLENPWFRPEDIGDTVRVLATWAFWIIFLAVAVLHFQERNTSGATEVQVEGPAFARFLFSNTQAGWFWLPIRLFVGFAWLEAGWHKLAPNAAGVWGAGWLDGGSALKGFWTSAVAIPDQGRPPISFEWYREFLNVMLTNQWYVWFAWLIVFGELLVGIGLLLGALTGPAAFFGALMNSSFMLAGSASTNPVLFTMAIGLMLGWKVAGYIGFDRYLLPLVGVPWRAQVQTTQPVGAPTPTTT